MFRDDAIIKDMLRIDKHWGICFWKIGRLDEAMAREQLRAWVKSLKADIQAGRETVISSVKLIDAMCYDQLSVQGVGQLTAIFLEVSYTKA